MGDDKFATHDPLTGQVLCSCIKSNADDSVDMTGCPVHAPSQARDDAEEVVLTPEELALSAPIGIEGIPLAFYQKDVERIIAARLAAHRAVLTENDWESAWSEFDEHGAAGLERIINEAVAAHMAAPDELTGED